MLFPFLSQQPDTNDVVQDWYMNYRGHGCFLGSAQILVLGISGERGFEIDHIGKVTWA